MIWDILAVLFSSLLFLFVFWIRLREDYGQNQIFTAGFYVLFGMGCGNILADNFFNPWWFWAGLVGGLLGLIYTLKRFHLRFFETFETFIISALALLFAIGLNELFKDYSFTSLMFLLAVGVFIGLFIFLDTRYKKFSWYKSGRIGFAGLTIAGLFFLVRSVVAMSSISVLSFAGEAEVVISGLISFASFITVYNLSEKT